MTLVLEIEHLLGVAFAAQGQAIEAPEWPPQPDRVFSALTAAWGTRGERCEERLALEWLEAQSCPEIVASDGSARTAPIVFVPPNDPESHKVADAMVMPGLRRRQPRRFPAFRPDDPVMTLIWRDATPDAGTLAALNALAADTAYVGHSASLTRCRFRDGETPATGAPPRRRVYPGRLAELESDYHALPLRRPSPGVPVGERRAGVGRAVTGVFSDRWLVLEHVAGEMPDIRAAALVAKALRDAMMSGYREVGLGAAIPAAVSGHSPDGKPSSEPHLAIAPMAFLGSAHASGAVFGFALIPPRREDLLADPDFQRAVRRIMRPADEDRRMIVLDGLGLAFAVGGETERRSLDPARYVAAARVWASGSPIVLDRHLKEEGNEARQLEIEGLVSRACANTGLPAPKRVVASKHSANEGAPSAYPAGSEPRWMRWRVPESLASRQLTHAVVEFAEPVHGPVILGAGRFVGLGVCLPLDAEGRR
jgi:CRISPR-associated protein Csb2